MSDEMTPQLKTEREGLAKTLYETYSEAIGINFPEWSEVTKQGFYAMADFMIEAMIEAERQGAEQSKPLNAGGIVTSPPAAAAFSDWARRQPRTFHTGDTIQFTETYTVTDA